MLRLKDKNMSLENEIKQAINNALDELNIVAKFDSDNDLEITLMRGKEEISQTYVELNAVFLQIEP